MWEKMVLPQKGKDGLAIETYIKVLWGSKHKLFIRRVQPVEEYCVGSFWVKL